MECGIKITNPKGNDVWSKTIKCLVEKGKEDNYDKYALLKAWMTA